MELMTSKQVCEYLQCGMTSLYKWGVPKIKFGRSARYDKQAVDEWINERIKSMNEKLTGVLNNGNFEQ